jgi:hypothetical protein
MVIVLGGMTSPALLSPEEINRHMEAAKRAFDKVDASKSKAQVRPNQNALITPREIRTVEQWSNIDVLPGLTLSDAQWQEFEQAKLTFYVFEVARFEDDGHKGYYWKYENCFYLVSVLSFWHNCGLNRLDLVASK